MTSNSTEVIFGINKKYCQKNQGQGAHTLSTRVGAPPPPLLGHAPCLMGPWTSTDLNSNSIYLLSQRKKLEKKFHRVLRYKAATKP